MPVAKTLDDLMGEIRLMLKDRRAPYRYSDADIVEGVNTALREVKRLRPDAYLSYTNVTEPVFAVTALPDYSTASLAQVPPTAFPLEEIFYLPVVYHVVGKLQLGDDEFAVDNRAMTLLAAFRQQLLGG